MYRATFALLKELGRERTANAVLLYNGWSLLKSDIGDIVGSVKLVESGIEIGRALRVDAAPDHFVSLNYARRLVPLHRLDEAEEYFSKASRMSSDEEDAEMGASARMGLLAVRRERDDIAGARTAQEGANQFILAHLPPEHALRVQFVYESGLLDLADKAFDDARTRLQQALSQYQRANTHVPNQIVALAGLARCELASGERGRAERFAADATALARKFTLPGQPSYWVGLSLLAQVDVEQALGHRVRARELSLEALSQLTPTVGADHPLTKKAAALTRMSALGAAFR
jgi:tetratricopeptide (TPR) repeat protein